MATGLELWQQLAVLIIFCWSGFIRTGLGFGGALLTMPFLLLIDNRPLVYLPIIAVHLLIFATLNFTQDCLRARSLNPLSDNIDWAYLKRSVPIMLLPKIVGVAGLITLPAYILSSIIFAMVTIYAIHYLLGREFRARAAWVETLFLITGAYISGTSLIGGPLLIAVFANHVAKEKLRATLFVLWCILVSIKMVAFIIADVDLQWRLQLWLLPAATVGHIFGTFLHRYLIQRDTKVFFRYLGAVLLLASSVGLIKELVT